MADHAAAMTMMRLLIVQLRTLALTYHALVARGVLLPKEAADLFREPMQFVDEEHYDAETVRLYREAHESCAKEIAELRPGKPLPLPQRRARKLV